MASDRWLLRMERENVMFFGIRWSMIGCLMALALLSGCSLFDSGAVRYNTVVGEKRVPTLNPGGTGYAATDMAKRQTMVSGAQQMVLPQSMSQMPAGGPVVQHYSAPMMPQAAPSGSAQAAYAPTSMPQSQPSGQAYPVLAPAAGPTQQQLSAGDAAIQADINALERDLAQSQTQQQQLAGQQSQDSWLPNLGVGQWFGGDSASMPAPQAAPARNGTYPPMQLPVPGAPAASAMDVPLAPPSSHPLTNVPGSLIPPGAEEGNYLEDSRYAARRGQRL